MRYYFLPLIFGVMLLPEVSVSMEEKPYISEPEKVQPIEQKLSEDGLPEDVEERNDFLKRAWTFFRSDHSTLVRMNDDHTVNSCMSGLQTICPYPFNPFRSPNISDLYMMPTTDDDRALIRSSMIQAETWFFHLVRRSNSILKNHNFFAEEIGSVPKNFLGTFLTKYYETLENMTDLLQKEKFPARYYLPRSAKNAHDLIRATAFQKDSYSDQEVIVLDVNHMMSRLLAYKNKESPFEFSGEFSRKTSDTDEISHGAGVAGVMGARNIPDVNRIKRTILDVENHLKGVAPGVKIIPMAWQEGGYWRWLSNLKDGDYRFSLSNEQLKFLENTKARVINISMQLPIYLPCLTHDYARLTKEEQQICRSLDQFFHNAQKKDIILVMSAGNEGLMLERFDPKTGRVEKDLRGGVKGSQYLQSSYPMFKTYRHTWAELSDIVHLVPQLKDRVIFVGNLKADGIIPAALTSLPGALADAFMFAPSEGVKTIDPSVGFGEDPKNPKARMMEFGEFGGTSGAAPRVSGALVILHQKFPDLPMTTIRTCLLKSGYPFWKDFGSHFSWVQRVSTKENGSLTDYGKMLFGQGRLDVEAAYHSCYEENEKLRKRRRS